MKVLSQYALQWVDLLVLCSIKELEEYYFSLTTKDIIQYLGMNGPWVYRSVRRLREKELIQVEASGSAWEGNPIGLTMHGQVLFNRIRSKLRNSHLEPVLID